MIETLPTDHGRSARLLQLDIKHLIAFEAIYTTGNLSRAAKLLNLAQPTLSNMLKRMRDVFEDKLFIRREGRMAPTALADSIVLGVRRILQECQALGVPPTTFDPKTSKRLFRLHFIDIFEAIVLPELVKDYVHFPEISYKALIAPKVPIAQALESGEADLALGMAPPNNQKLRWKAMMPIELVAIAHKDNPHVKGPLTPEQFRQLGHVSLDFDDGALANAATFRPSHRIERKDILRVTRPGAVLDIVASSDLVGVVHPIQLKTSLHRHQIKQIDVPLPKLSQYFQMTWHERSATDAGLAWLMSRIENILSQHLPLVAEN